MRYLYGDSAPFPLQYNFLATLEIFVAAAARAVEVEQKLAAMRAAHAASAAGRAQELEELRAFHGRLVNAIHETKKQAATPSTAELASKVEDFAKALVEDARRAATVAAERDAQEERDEADKRRGEARAACEQFLLAGKLPALESKVHLRLVDGRNDVTATFTNPHSISTSFAIAAREAPAWRKERKVSDFMKNLDVQVGVKKSLFKRTMQPEVLHLDDFVIGAFDLSDDSAEIHLRRRVDTKDVIVFRLVRDDTELTAEVQRPGEEGGELPTPVDSTDKAKLEQLWQLLRAGIGEALQHKERLLGVKLDDKELFAEPSITPFFQRVLKFFGPIVSEIAKRSPNPNELSLKVEEDGGRREEIYVKKADLVAKIDALDGEARAIFAPLQLSKAPSAKAEAKPRAVEPTLTDDERPELPSVDVHLDE